MDNNKIIIIFAISVGLIICIIGIILSNLILIVIGPVIAILLFIFPYIKISKEKKKKLFIPEDEYETILSVKSKRWKRRSKILGYFMAIIFGLIVFSIIWFFVGRYLSKPSSIPLSMENIINDGCRKLNPGTGHCEKDPSTIIVDYDVNEDGIIGGVDDTLSNLLEKQDCTGDCIKQRCGCLN